MGKYYPVVVLGFVVVANLKFPNICHHADNSWLRSTGHRRLVAKSKQKDGGKLSSINAFHQGPVVEVCIGSDWTFTIRQLANV